METLKVYRKGLLTYQWEIRKGEKLLAWGNSLTMGSAISAAEKWRRTQEPVLIREFRR